TCDLTPCGFFLCGRNSSVINDINRDVCERVITNSIDRDSLSDDNIQQKINLFCLRKKNIDSD
ncbi:hypothetical protein L9F63_022533, partial [Diploptera punctata]